MRTAEADPVARIWFHLRERYPSHKLLDSYDAIVDAVCMAWDQLTPKRLYSLTATLTSAKSDLSETV